VCGGAGLGQAAGDRRPIKYDLTSSITTNHIFVYYDNHIFGARRPVQRVGRTYVVADVEYAGEVRFDVGVIARHERRVAHDTQRDAVD